MKKIAGYIYNGQLWSMKGKLLPWDMESSEWAGAPAAQAWLQKHGLTLNNVTVFSSNGKWLVGKATSTTKAQGLSYERGEHLFEGFVYDKPPLEFGSRRINDELWVRVGKRVVKL